MLGKLFKAKPTTPAPTVAATASINDRVQPMHRHERYEDPLQAFLQKHALGNVVGGGTLLGELKEVSQSDVELALTSADEASCAAIIAELERLGAPRGSRLIVHGQADGMPFGRNEGLAVYLNGTELSDEVYAECDANEVYAAFSRLLGDEGSVHSWWQGPSDTALYMYGPSFARMQALLQDFIASYPLCQQARLVQIA